MPKRDLIFRRPMMNAAGSLGFAPDLRAPIPWDDFGAFVSNPLSLRPRTAAAEPALIEFPGGFLLHTGLPNPGFESAVKKYSRRWVDSPLPTIVHLMADRPEETKQMVQKLEGVENVMAAELGFAPLLTNDIILLTLEMCLGELPLIFSLPAEQILSLGSRLMDAGASAISISPPRGALRNGRAGIITGRLYGPALFPQSLEVVRTAVKIGIPIIAAGGVYSKENADVMISVGALAVQVDAALWLPANKKNLVA